MRLRFTPRAIRDVTEIGDYIAGQNPEAAGRVRAAILDTLRNLLAFPKLGRRQEVEGVRKIRLRAYPYLIYYTIDAIADDLVVLTIRHAARQREYKDT